MWSYSIELRRYNSCVIEYRHPAAPPFPLFGYHKPVLMMCHALRSYSRGRIELEGEDSWGNAAFICLVHTLPKTAPSAMWLASWKPNLGTVHMVSWTIAIQHQMCPAIQFSTFRRHLIE